MEKDTPESIFKFHANLAGIFYLWNHFSVETNTNLNLLNMAVAVGTDEIYPSGSKMPHRH